MSENVMKTYLKMDDSEKKKLVKALKCGQKGYAIGWIARIELKTGIKLTVDEIFELVSEIEKDI